MKKQFPLLLSALLFALLASCAPGSTVQVSTPATNVTLGVPGPNPLINQPDVAGRIARAGAGLWHGLIAPATLLVSFFDSDIRMYEVHNAGSEYDLGFMVGLGVDFIIIGILLRLRRTG